MSVSWPDGLEVRELSWAGPEAAGLRAQMDAEIMPRYAGLRFDAAPALVVDPALVLLTLVVFDGETPVATAALKKTDDFFEVKRVFVAPSHRRLGLAGLLLAALAERARALGAAELVLQTGFRQPEAITLYERNGWTAIPNFGPYVVDTVISRCFGMPLTPRLVGVHRPGTAVAASPSRAELEPRSRTAS